MKERPILFSAPMVRAILEGRKTQTRRVVKPRRSDDSFCIVEQGDGSWWPYRSEDGESFVMGDGREYPFDSPYGQTGDRLWVKEGWAQEHPLAVQEGRYSQEGRAGIPGPPGVTFRVVYRADGEPLQVWRRGDQKHPYFTTDGPADEIAAEYPTVSSNFKRGGKAIYWDSPLFMERQFSRITLEVTGVRVERLWKIDDADARAEGVYPTATGLHSPGQFIGEYAKLWDQINAERGPWASNPWVWVIEFKRLPCKH